MGQLSADSSLTETLLFKQKSRAYNVIVKYELMLSQCSCPSHTFNTNSQNILLGFVFVDLCHVRLTEKSLSIEQNRRD